MESKTVKRICIYVLVDPRNGDYRYVGKTKNPNTRVSCHMWQAHSGNEKTLKAQWILELIEIQQRPELKVLEKVTDSESAKIKERDWMLKLWNEGQPLLNVRLPKIQSAAARPAQDRDIQEGKRA